MASRRQLLRKLYVLTRTFGRDTSGATAIEYALIASLVAVIIIGAVIGLGTSLMLSFENTAAAIQ